MPSTFYEGMKVLWRILIERAREGIVFPCSQLDAFSSPVPRPPNAIALPGAEAVVEAEGREAQAEVYLVRLRFAGNPTPVTGAFLGRGENRLQPAFSGRAELVGFAVASCRRTDEVVVYGSSGRVR